MPIRTLVGLILCNLVWSANPVAGKALLTDFSPGEAAWLRYFSALVAYAAASPLMRGEEAFLMPRSRSTWIGVSLLGFLTFCFSPLLQLNGLRASGAAINALIVAMEPLMAIFLAWGFLREGLSHRIRLVLALALVGFLLLSGLTPGALGENFEESSYSIGSVLILFSLIGEASFSVLGKKLIRTHAPQPLFGSVLAMGVVFLTVAAGASGEFASLDVIHRFSWRSALGLLWLGPLGTALTYLYWMKALAKASVASIAVTLFIQPVFGAILGIVLLREALSSAQLVGAALILLAVSLQAIFAGADSSSRAAG